MQSSPHFIFQSLTCFPTDHYSRINIKEPGYESAWDVLVPSFCRVGEASGINGIDTAETATCKPSGKSAAERDCILCWNTKKTARLNDLFLVCRDGNKQF